MSIDNAKALLAPLCPEGRHFEAGDGFLDLVASADDQSLSLGIGVIPSEDDEELYLVARVVIYAAAFGDVEEVDEAVVLAKGAEALGLPEGLDCEVGIEVYDGSTDDEGRLVPVEEEGEVEVDAFEISFSPEPALDKLDTELLRSLIAGAPFILPEDE